MNKIKELRLKNGWLQTDLADKLNTGKNTISRYETGQREMDTETLFKLCDIFGVTADYLLGRSDTSTFDLSEEEQKLLAAYRLADPRSQAMVKLALQPWTNASKKEAVS